MKYQKWPEPFSGGLLHRDLVSVYSGRFKNIGVAQLAYAFISFTKKVNAMTATLKDARVVSKIIADLINPVSMINNLKDVVKKVTESYQPEKIILHGSYGKKRTTKDSDIDLLIIKDSESTRER